MSPKSVWGCKENLKTIAELTLPQTYMEIPAYLGLAGHYWQFINGFAHIVQPLHKHLSGEGYSKKSEQVMLTSEAKDTFEMLKKTCLKAPVLAFANFDKPFLLETDARKLGLGTMLSQKQTDGWYHLRITIIQWNKSFSAKLGDCQAVQEYLLWKPFIVRTNTIHSPTSWLCLI